MLTPHRMLRSKSKWKFTSFCLFSSSPFKMSTLSLVLKILYNYFLPPFICVLILILLLASFGKSLGIRRLYVAWLLKVFKVRYLNADVILLLYYDKNNSFNLGQNQFIRLKRGYCLYHCFAFLFICFIF